MSFLSPNKFTAFDPSSVGQCSLWLDSNDASKYSLTGNLMDSWTNKAAGGMVFASSGSDRPVKDTTTFPGKTCFNFEPNKFVYNSTGISVSGPLSFFIVSYYTPVQFSNGWFTLGNGVDYYSGRPSVEIFLNGGGIIDPPYKRFGYVAISPSTMVQMDDQYSSNNTKVIDTLVVGNPIEDSKANVNMVPSGPTTIGGPSPGMLVNTIGSRDISYTASIKVAEILLYNRALDDYTTNQVEWYLKNKWGTP